MTASLIDITSRFIAENANLFSGHVLSGLLGDVQYLIARWFRTGVKFTRANSNALALTEGLDMVTLDDFEVGTISASIDLAPCVQSLTLRIVDSRSAWFLVQVRVCLPFTRLLFTENS
jgi:hypothetical protein